MVPLRPSELGSHIDYVGKDRRPDTVAHKIDLIIIKTSNIHQTFFDLTSSQPCRNSSSCPPTIPPFPPTPN